MRGVIIPILGVSLRRSIVAALVCGWAGSCGAETIFLEKDGTRVGVRPDTAGRIVALHFRDGPNLVDAGHIPGSGGTHPPLDYVWVQDRGEVIWAGPQATWWKDQNVLPEKRGADWPPDPDWTLARFHILDQSPSRIVLQSPVSRITGLQLTKTIECLPGGNVRLHARAQNAGKFPVERDLWFVFRAPASCRDFVPVDGPGAVRLIHSGDSRIQDGLHSLVLPVPDKTGLVFEKAGIQPGAPWIACQYPEGFLIFRFPAVPASAVAPGQAPVEIYRKEEPGQPPLLEIETHSALARLQPGESLESWQTWEFLVLPLSHPDPVAFLKKAVGDDPGSQ